MNRIIVSIAIFQLAVFALSAQPNNGVEEAWKSLYKRDQVEELKRTKESTNANLRDACNLILKYGYPDGAEYRIQRTPILCLIHCTSPSYQITAYPIIYAGYLGGQIDTLEMANYVTRSVHNNLFHRNSKKYKNAQEAAKFIFDFHKIILSYLAHQGEHYQPCDSCYQNFLNDFSLPIDTLVSNGKQLGAFALDLDPFYWRMKRQKARELTLFQFGSNYYFLAEGAAWGFRLKLDSTASQNGQAWYQLPPFISEELVSISVNESGAEVLIVKVGEKVFEFSEVQGG